MCDEPCCATITISMQLVQLARQCKCAIKFIMDLVSDPCTSKAYSKSQRTGQEWSQADAAPFG